MPIKSRFFSGDKRFEDCLVSDPAHITPGARGTHVARIQSALTVLDGATIGLAERLTYLYGPETEAAVLAYKRKRSIINKAYQQQADAIVGKMTMASLDAEIMAVEPILSPPGRMHHPRPHPRIPPRPARGAPAGVRPSPLHTLATRGMVQRRFGASPAIRAGDDDVFIGKAAAYPTDLQDIIRRTGAAKTPGDGRFLPFISNELGPQTAKQMSAYIDDPRFAEAEGILIATWRRMEKLSVHRYVDTLLNVYRGKGAAGFGCVLTDEDAVAQLLIGFTRMRVVMHHPLPIPHAFVKPTFCQDIYNVHGERDTWRELTNIPFGPALHYCIPRKAIRGTNHPDATTDIHIDDFQQDQVNVAGSCVPLPGPATMAHLESVKPYLLGKAKAQVDAILKKILADHNGK